MPVTVDVRLEGKDVVDLVDRLGGRLDQCFDWLVSKNVHMHVWKTELTIEKLGKATRELQDKITIAEESAKDAKHYGWPLEQRVSVEGWIREGRVYKGHAREVVVKYSKLMADPTGSVLHYPCETLSRRTLNCRAILTLNNILEHTRKGKDDYVDVPWRLWPQQGNREEPMPSSDDCAWEETFATPSSNELMAPTSDIQKMKLSGLAKYHAIPRDESLARVPVMIRVNAPAYTGPSRAAIDLVMVLDAHERMRNYGKLDQLKEGCRFVILSLEEGDRLSIVTFGETKELLPLTSMSTDGKTLAKVLVNTLQARGKTTAGPAMDLAYKILDRRQDRNPVSRILLLADGKNKRIYDESSRSANGELPVPPKRRKYPTYTFGFGLDHDPRTLYYLATSGYGTYSYVTDNRSIRDAMALCIGGLTSIVAQDVTITINSAREDVEIVDIMSGGYYRRPLVASGGTSSGFVIDVKDLYANEEKKFIVYVNVPREEAAAAIFAIFPAGTPKTKLLAVTAKYYCPLTGANVSTDKVEVSVERPRKLRGRDRGISVEVAGEVTRAVMFNRVEEVWRQSIPCTKYSYKNLRVAFEQLPVELDDLKKSIESTKEAHEARERWDDLVMDLENMKKNVSDIDRITGIDLYSSGITGMPYMLSWLSSHRWQRAATPGSSSKSRWFNFRTIRMQNMIDSVDIAPIGL